MSKKTRSFTCVVIMCLLVCEIGCSNSQQPTLENHVELTTNTCPPAKEVTVKETVIVKETVVVTQTVLVLLAPTEVKETPAPSPTWTEMPTLTNIPTRPTPEPTISQPTQAPPSATPSATSEEVKSYLATARTQNGNFFNLLNSRSDFIDYNNTFGKSIFNYYAWAVSAKPTLSLIRSAIEASAPPFNMEGIKAAQLAACDHLDTAIKMALADESHYSQEVDLAYTSAMEAENMLNQYPK